jgi:hypothetical protein
MKTKQLKKEKIMLKDGRYLIYYAWDKPKKTKKNTGRK